ncbi:MAG: hydrogenase/urease maturation nickel metallochaperone HypA [Chloroflexi bacterium]|nr:hydrogenase/urease maturation nickel metallochaperone HypA [Chloroflexota bacterium]
MHERSLMRALVRRIITIAQEHQAERVRKVVVRTGVLGHGLVGHLHEHFRREVQGTLLEGATLEIVWAEDLIDLALDSLELDLPEA